MKPFSKIRMAASIVMLPIMLGAFAAQGAEVVKLDDPTLMRWQNTYDSIRDMTPKWGAQGTEAFKTSVDAGVPIVFIDVRTPQEWSEGIIPDAIMINLNDLPKAQSIAKLPADTTAIIGVYCKAGHRSTLALTFLNQLGYKNAISMNGGMTAWVKAGYPVAKGPAMAPAVAK